MKSQDFELRLIIKCLENISNREQGTEKERIQSMIKKLQRREIREAKNLNQQQTQLMNLLMQGFYGYREALNDLMKLEKYKVVKDTTSFDGGEFILNLQPFLNIDKSNATLDNLFSKYTVQFIKLKKTYQHFPKEFSGEWTAKAKEKVAERVKMREAKKMPIKPESQVEYEDSQQESQIVSKPPRAVPSIVRDNRQKQRELQKMREKQLQKEIVRLKEKQRQQQELLKERQNRKPQLQPRETQRPETIREPKSKVSTIQKYLQTRKDLHISSNKIRDISEHLASLLDNYMRDTLGKLASIAKLKNKKNPRMGGELSYFSQQNQRISANIQKAFHIQPNTKIFSINYKHKLEIYTTHRHKEFRKEDELRQGLEIKTNEFEKRVDKKVETYILKPRSKQAESVAMYHDDKEYPRTNSLSVNIEHIIYFINGHQLLRNSPLLWEIYFN